MGGVRAWKVRGCGRGEGVGDERGVGEEAVVGEMG